MIQTAGGVVVTASTDAEYANAGSLANVAVTSLSSKSVTASRRKTVPR